MYRRPKLHLHIGLRIFKTALAVTIAMLVARLVDSYSPIFAGLGAVVAMARTLPESLEAARTQVVALVFGALVAFGILWLDPTPSPLLIGVGVLAVLSVCALCRLYYAVSLAAIIVLSACVSTSGDPMLALLYRLLDTSIGLAAGVAVNMLVKPYNNRARVTALLQRLAGRVPACLDACVLQDLYPDLTPLETDLRALDVELDLYRRQHFRQREAHERDTAFLTGLEQLAERMFRELQTLCCMDAIGIPDCKNRAALAALGLDTSPADHRPSSPEVDVVTNYHLRKALEARSYLLAMLDLPPEV